MYRETTTSRFEYSNEIYDLYQRPYMIIFIWIMNERYNNKYVFQLLAELKSNLLDSIFLLSKYISENCVVSSISMYAAIIYKFRMEPSKKNLYPRFISNKMLVRGGSVIAIFICGTNIHEYKTFNNHRTQNQQV